MDVADDPAAELQLVQHKWLGPTLGDMAVPASVLSVCFCLAMYSASAYLVCGPECKECHLESCCFPLLPGGVVTSQY